MDAAAAAASLAAEHAAAEGGNKDQDTSALIAEAVAAATMAANVEGKVAMQCACKANTGSSRTYDPIALSHVHSHRCRCHRCSIGGQD